MTRKGGKQKTSSSKNKQVAKAVTKRENWNHHYVSVTRINGRFAKRYPREEKTPVTGPIPQPRLGKWETEQVPQIRLPTRESRYPQFSPRTRYVYVVKGKDVHDVDHTLFASSPRLIDMAGKKSRNRKDLYEYIGETCSLYDFDLDISSFKLVATYDHNLGVRTVW